MNIQLNISIDDRIIHFLKSVFTRKRAALPLIILTVVSSAAIYAATGAGIPHLFRAGTVISADEVNENFNALFQKVNELALAVPSAPVGTIMAFAGPEGAIPDGWLLCDGSLLDKADPKYAELYQAIETKWGGQGANNFRLPDLRGEFLRGVDGDRGLDPDKTMRKNYDGIVVGDIVGSYQEDAFESHTHYMARPDDGFSGSGPISSYWNGTPITDGTGNPRTGKHSSETRPKNAAVNFIIKY